MTARDPDPRTNDLGSRGQPVSRAAWLFVLAIGLTGFEAGGQTPPPRPGGLLLQIYPDPGGAPVEVHEVDRAGGFVWIATESGLFRYRRGQERPAPVQGGPKPAYTVKAVGDQVWAGGLDGLYRIVDLSGRLLLKRPEVRVIEAADDGVLIGTAEGHFFLPSADLAPLREEGLVAIPGDLGTPRIARRLLDRWWLGTERDAYRLEEGFQATSVEARPIGQVLAIEPWGNRVCFVSAQGVLQSQLRCSTPEGVTEQPLPDPGLGITAFGVLRRQVAGRWVEEPLVGTAGDLHRLEGRGQQRTVPGFAELLSTTRSEVVNFLFDRDDRLVVVTDRRVYLRQDEAWSAVPEAAEEAPGLTRGADLGPEGAWVWGRRGAYRLEEDGHLAVKFLGELRKGLLVVPSPVLRFDNVGYVDAAGRPLAVPQPPSDFKAVVVDRQMDLREPSPGWTPVRQVNHPLDRRGVVYYEVRDGFGNRTIGEQRYQVEGGNCDDWWCDVGKPVLWTLLIVLVLISVLLLAARFRPARLVLAQIAEGGGWKRNVVEFLLQFKVLSAQLLRHYKSGLMKRPRSTAEPGVRRQRVQKQLQRLMASPNEPWVEPIEPDAEQELDRALLEVLLAQRKDTNFPIFLELPAETAQQLPEVLAQTLERSAATRLEEEGDLQKEALARLVLSSRRFVLVLRAEKAAVEVIKEAWSIDRVGDCLLYIKELQSGALEPGEGTGLDRAGEV